MKPDMKAVVIGASAGAVDALSIILPTIPAGFPLPIFIVVHIPPDKKSLLAEIMRPKCKIAILEAEDKMPVMQSTAYFAPPDYHLMVENNGQLSLSSEEPEFFSRPSIDVLFETAADAYGESLIGVVLTGANSDGAKGLKAVMDAGGIGLVQKTDDVYASAMPEAALALCPDAHALGLLEISQFLQESVSL